MLTTDFQLQFHCDSESFTVVVHSTKAFPERQHVESLHRLCNLMIAPVVHVIEIWVCVLVYVLECWHGKRYCPFCLCSTPEWKHRNYSGNIFIFGSSITHHEQCHGPHKKGQYVCEGQSWMYNKIWIQRLRSPLLTILSSGHSHYWSQKSPCSKKKHCPDRPPL